MTRASARRTANRRATVSRKAEGVNADGIINSVDTTVVRARSVTSLP